MLLDYGADAALADCRGVTPLFTACAQGHEEVVDLLLGELLANVVNKLQHRPL